MFFYFIEKANKEFSKKKLKEKMFIDYIYIYIHHIQPACFEEESPVFRAYNALFLTTVNTDRIHQKAWFKAELTASSVCSCGSKGCTLDPLWTR